MSAVAPPTAQATRCSPSKQTARHTWPREREPGASRFELLGSGHPCRAFRRRPSPFFAPPVQTIEVVRVLIAHGSVGRAVFTVKPERAEAECWRCFRTPAVAVVRSCRAA